MQSRDELTTMQTLLRLLETSRRDADNLDRLTKLPQQKHTAALQNVIAKLNTVAQAARKALADTTKEV